MAETSSIKTSGSRSSSINRPDQKGSRYYVISIVTKYIFNNFLNKYTRQIYI